MTTDDEQTYKDALLYFGEESQIKQAIEECAELIVTLHHSDRGKASIADVASEIADVEIMMGQMRVLVGDDLVESEKCKKLDRLRSIIMQGESA